MFPFSVSPSCLQLVGASRFRTAREAAWRECADCWCRFLTFRVLVYRGVVCADLLFGRVVLGAGRARAAVASRGGCMYIEYGLVQQEIMLLQRQLDVMRVDDHAYPPPGTRTRASARKLIRWSDVRHRAAHLPSPTSDAHRTWQLPRSEVAASSCTPDATVATTTSRRTMTTDPTPPSLPPPPEEA